LEVTVGATVSWPGAMARLYSDAMTDNLFELLRCPECRHELDPRAGEPAGRTDASLFLQCRGCGRSYPVIRSVPRFVPEHNYAASFGFQWNRFRKTQLDSHTGAPISRNRFMSFTGWGPQDLAGKIVLDVGCGAGRFAEIALSMGATVVALDYSDAVDACQANLGQHPQLLVAQGDIYKLPFSPESFDFVYCLGVLQHTPDVERAFRALVPQVKPGGRLAVDLYPRLLLNLFWPKYWLRPLTRRLPPQKLFSIVERLVPLLLPVSEALRRVPGSRGKLRYLMPVANYRGVFRLSEGQLREWAVLDTFDMLASNYDQPQSARTLRRWLTDAGLDDIAVERPGFLVGRGRKPEG
jgi:SAM-dependent methyltransferase